VQKRVIQVEYKRQLLLRDHPLVDLDLLLFTLL
jgi:hypothetical protein